MFFDICLCILRHMSDRPRAYLSLLPHHHHHVALVARISLTLSRHSSLSFIALGRSSGQHPVSSHSCWMYVRADRPAFARPCVGVHKSTSLMSSSLLPTYTNSYTIPALKNWSCHKSHGGVQNTEDFFYFFVVIPCFLQNWVIL